MSGQPISITKTNIRVRRANEVLTKSKLASKLIVGETYLTALEGPMVYEGIRNRRHYFIALKPNGSIQTLSAKEERLSFIKGEIYVDLTHSNLIRRGTYSVGSVEYRESMDLLNWSQN